MTDRLAQLGISLADRYRIERELGAGGMATVYLAHDVRHDRKVALKVLRPELAAVIGGERFLAEIKTTANLQHPHILALFDSGQVDGTVFYVMPFVEGESLRDRLQREKLLPIDDALQIAKEVAGALDYAHRHGVIHRDIKPENILLHDGTALVADFGIALAASRTEGSARMTETGMSLGTPYYMSPEQAMGERSLDARTDQYALGCVVYEMITGEPPFTGATAQAIVAKVLTATPERPTTIRPSLPSGAEVAVLKSLSKLPADRFRSVAEFSAALGQGDVARPVTASMDTTRARSATRPSRMAFVPWLIATAAVLSAIVVVAGDAPMVTSAVTRSIVPLTLRAPVDTPLDGLGVPFDISSDGHFIIFVGPDPKSPAQTMLWRRSLDQLEGTPIAGTGGAHSPRISPDGSTVMFVVRSSTKDRDQIHVLPLSAGGVSTTLPGGEGSGWLPDGSMVLSERSVLLRNSLSGKSAPESLAIGGFRVRQTRAAGAADGKHLVFARQGGDRDSVVVWSNDDQSFATILEGKSPRFVDDEHLAYVASDGTLFVTRIDGRTIRPIGRPAALAHGIAFAGNGEALYAMARDGTLMYASGGGAQRGRLVWVDRAGVERPLDGNPVAAYSGLEIAPDGRHAAVVEGGLFGRGDLWIIGLIEASRNRFTNDDRSVRPAWYPSGTQLTYAVAGDSSVTFVNRSVNASSTADTLFSLRGGPTVEARWSPDMKYIVIRSGGQGNRDISYRRATALATDIPFATEQYQESTPQFSPDGRWLAYVSNRTGRDEVYLDAFPQGGARQSVSLDGGREPVWSREGREVYFRSLDNFLMAARIDSRVAQQVQVRTKLFNSSPYLANQFLRMYDVTPDGRFLFIKLEEQQVRTDVVLVRNWISEVLARLGETPK